MMDSFVFDGINQGLILALVPVVIALTQGLKQIKVLEGYSVLVALGAGMLLYTLMLLFPFYGGIVLGGLIVGLSAAGLYSMGKSQIKEDVKVEIKEDAKAAAAAAKASK